MANPANIEYLVNGTEQVSPLNWDVIGLTADLTQDFAELQLTESTLVFEGKDATLLKGILDNIGLEAAIPITIRIPSNDPLIADIEEPFVLNVKTDLEIADTLIRFGVQRRYGINRFMDRANKTTWDIINTQTPITGAVNFPYREVNANPRPELAMLSMQAGTSLIAAYDSAVGIANAVAAVAGGLTGLAESIIQLALEAARAILLGVVIAKTANRLFQIAYPKQKYFYEIKERDLMRQGCEYLGFTLSSTLLDANANVGYIPVPIQDTNKSALEDIVEDVSYHNGKFPSSYDSIPTFGLFFTAVKEKYDAQVLIIGQTLHFETEQFYQQNPVVTIKETLTEQEDLENLHRFNIDESWFHKIIRYQTDLADRYTLDKPTGLRAEYKTVYTGTAAPDLLDIDGSKQVNIPFALARRKNKLSYLDEQAIIFGSIVDAITNVFGNGTNLVQSVQSSIGQMIISGQNFTKTKMTYAVGGKQTPDYLERIGAKAIYTNYHTQNQVKENFQRLKEMTVPFSVQNFRDIINGRYVLNQSNDLLKLKTYTWMPTDAQIQLKTGKFVPELSKTKTELIHG